MTTGKAARILSSSRLRSCPPRGSRGDGVVYVYCVCAGMHTYMHTYIHTCMHACIHTYIHTYIHACMHACIHICIHTYVHTHAHIHTLSNLNCQRQGTVKAIYSHAGCGERLYHIHFNVSGEQVSLSLSLFLPEGAPHPSRPSSRLRQLCPPH